MNVLYVKFHAQMIKIPNAEPNHRNQLEKGKIRFFVDLVY